MIGKLGLLTAVGITSLVGFDLAPSSSSADIAALAEARLKLTAPCEWQCFYCPGLEEHSLIAGGPYVGLHPENCVPEGSCADHFCSSEEDQDREDFAAFVAEVERLSIDDLGGLMRALPPTMIALDRQTRSVVVFGCEEQVVARRPLSLSGYEALIQQR